MSESDVRRHVVKALESAHGIAIENGVCHPGTPDVAYIGGWVEVKELKEWPKREGTIVRLSHDFTPVQRRWHEDHWECGGRSWLLIAVSRTREWLVFNGSLAAKLLGKATKDRLRDNAVWVLRGTIDERKEALAECLLPRT